MSTISFEYLFYELKKNMEPEYNCLSDFYRILRSEFENKDFYAVYEFKKWVIWFAEMQIINSTDTVFENRPVFEVMSAIKAFLKNAFIVMCDDKAVCEFENFML